MIQELACDLLVLALWPVFIAKRCVGRLVSRALCRAAGVVPDRKPLRPGKLRIVR